MSVYKRGEVWWVKFQVHGRTVRRSTGTASKKEAEKFERNLRTRLEDDARAIQTGKSLNRSFGEALAKWLESGAPKSMLSHARRVRLYMETVPLARSIPASSDMKKAMLAEGLSPQTINRRLAVVRRVLNLAYDEWEWLTEPLGQRIKLLSEKGFSREVFLTKEVVMALFHQMKIEEAQRLILLAAFTGMRRSEIRRLDKDCWRRPNIVLPSKTKGGRPRVIPLVPELHWIMDHIPFQISEWDLRQDWEQARNALSLEHVRMHDLRHTFASWLVENPEVPLTVIRDLMGHSSLVVTSKYSHLRTDALEKAIGTLSAPLPAGDQSQIKH